MTTTFFFCTHIQVLNIWDYIRIKRLPPSIFRGEIWMAGQEKNVQLIYLKKFQYERLKKMLFAGQASEKLALLFSIPLRKMKQSFHKITI